MYRMWSRGRNTSENTHNYMIYYLLIISAPLWWRLVRSQDSGWHAELKVVRLKKQENQSRPTHKLWAAAEIVVFFLLTFFTFLFALFFIWYNLYALFIYLFMYICIYLQTLFFLHWTFIFIFIVFVSIAIECWYKTHFTAHCTMYNCVCDK